MNHPATDPFVFDLRRLRIAPEPYYRGFASVRYTYILPDGGMLSHVHVFAGGGAGGGAGFPPGLPFEARKLFHDFQQTVASLSAHQRMTWAAAAMAEGVEQ